MQFRALGSSGLMVPVIGMGTWSTFDVRAEAEIAARRAVVDAALDAGTTLFDTSPMYGESPRVLARALEGRRERAIVADKIWTSSAREGREQIRVALERFGTVDIYQIHNLVAWKEHLPVLEDLRAQGHIGVIGATHYSHGAFRELMRVMETGRIQMVQIPYHVADRDVEDAVLPLAASLGLGVLVMQPLGTGSLIPRAPSARELEPFRQFGVTTWAQLLLKWIPSDPRVHAVLPATRSAAHARENAAAGDMPWLDSESRERVAAELLRSG